MKAINRINDLRFYVAFAAVTIILASCSPKESSTPNPVFAIRKATGTTVNDAVIEASLIPYEAGITLSYELCSPDNQNWSSTLIPLVLNPNKLQDSIRFTFYVSDLKIGTEYKIRIRVKNSTGSFICDEKKFSTVAGYDIEANPFHQVTIGNQIWMVENLSVTHYQNGDPIATTTNPLTWWETRTGLFCWYNDDPQLGKVYGALYNWYVITDPRKIAIKGWHVPSIEECYELRKFLGGEQFAAPFMMEAGLSHWKMQSLPATNSSGFTALPGGSFATHAQGSNQMSFRGIGSGVDFWTTFSVGASALTMGVTATSYLEVESVYAKQFAYSIRLAKDKQ